MASCAPVFKNNLTNLCKSVHIVNNNDDVSLKLLYLIPPYHVNFLDSKYMHVFTCSVFSIMSACFLIFQGGEKTIVLYKLTFFQSFFLFIQNFVTSIYC